MFVGWCSNVIISMYKVSLPLSPPPTHTNISEHRCASLPPCQDRCPHMPQTLSADGQSEAAVMLRFSPYKPDYNVEDTKHTVVICKKKNLKRGLMRVIIK